MFDFPITPRESFLIGICVGEYMESRKTNQSCTFMSVIERRFAPFFPTFPNAPDRKEIESWMIPEETEWIEPSPGMEFGYAESCPSTLFVRSGSHLERLLWKPTTRRSLIELLLLRLSPSVSFSVGDRFNFPVTDRVDRAKAFFDLFRCVKHPESAFERSIETEQPERIVSWIRQRVSETGDRDLFELGHNFGELTGGLDSFEKSMSSLLSWYSSDPPIEEEEHWPPFVESDLTSQISTLKTHELVQRNNYASSALDQISRLRLRFAFPDDVESPMDVWGQYPTAASIARHASELVWTAIGELLGVLRDVDVAAQVRDAEAVTPRSLTDSDTDEVDRIRQILRMAELDLANNLNQQWRPEATVRQVYQEIEALTKRLWPSEFRTRKSYSLPALWRQKLYCDDEAEKRFAGIALNLYRSYRNVASHEADHFRCSPREARYFLSGIHVLLEIFERISNAADGDASR